MNTREFIERFSNYRSDGLRQRDGRRAEKPGADEVGNREVSPPPAIDQQ